MNALLEVTTVGGRLENRGADYCLLDLWDRICDLSSVPQVRVAWLHRSAA